MKKLLFSVVLVISVILIPSCSDYDKNLQDIISSVGSDLSLGGTAADTLFAVDGISGYEFNTSEIVVEGNKINSGNLSSVYVSSGVNGFAGLSEPVKGYFLPLEILSEGIDDRFDVRASFNGNEVPADILKSGDTWYVIVNIADNPTTDIDGCVLDIDIYWKDASVSTQLSIVERLYSGSQIVQQGLLLNPVIVPLQ